MLISWHGALSSHKGTPKHHRQWPETATNTERGFLMLFSSGSTPDPPLNIDDIAGTQYDVLILDCLI